jgi:hypothetical protein
MSACRSRGQSHVDASIHQNFRMERIRKRDDSRCEFKELPRGEIFFANLDPLDAGVQIAGSAFDQSRACR